MKYPSGSQIGAMISFDNLPETYGDGSYAPFCYNWENIDGTTVCEYCQKHAEMFATAVDLLSYGDAESALYSYGMWQQEIIALYDTWLMQLRVQFPSGQPSYGSIGNISYADDGVKITGKKLSELGGVIGSEEMPLPRNQKFASADSWEAGENANAERESQEKWESRFEPEELPYAEKMRQAKEVNRGQYATMADYERAVEERAEACKALGAALV